MRNRWTGAAALALSVTAAHAGGVERSDQSVTVLFQKGNYAELSLGSVSPNISGSIAGAPVHSGDMAKRYSRAGAAIKYDLDDKISLALIYDQPYGADVAYSAGGIYPLRGTTATLDTDSFTLLGRYKFTDRFSLHGGVRYQTMKAESFVNAVNNYQVVGEKDDRFGQVIGGAYEVPDIALRVSLTYNSRIKHKIDTRETFGFGAVVTPASVTEVDSPESVNLEFQTGVAAKTLVFGGVRWVNWTEFVLDPVQYRGATGRPFLSYEDDTYTYTLGVGHKFTDAWTGSLMATYEKENNGFNSNLGPTDGKIGLTLGARHTSGPVAISGGVNYTWIGDAKTRLGAATTSFKNNDAVGVGVKVGYSF